MTLTSIDEIIQTVIPIKGNRIVSGIVRHYTDKFKDDLIADEKKILLSRLVESLQPDKPVIFDYFQQEVVSTDGEEYGTTILSITTYFVNLLHCEIGEICYYEDPEESNCFELEHDSYYFKKIDGTGKPLWLRVS